MASAKSHARAQRIGIMIASLIKSSSLSDLAAPWGGGGLLGAASASPWTGAATALVTCASLLQWKRGGLAPLQPR